ncbi:MAG: hypothetical protein C5B47_03230 [Verrucomicrobia bacterium]|nr:MAG: hypothetical protein C5B47_03230 [Verrucomicrobiota bacterium]
MRVFTYYTPLKGKDESAEDGLMKLWKVSWKRFGWTPCILTAEDLPRDCTSLALLKAFSRHPTVNRRGLDYSCFARWLAVAQQGGGFMCDYDVINYGFHPREIGELTVYERHVPCLVSGTAEEFLRMCHLFANYPPDLKDRVGWRFAVSDMSILDRNPEIYLRKHDCVEYNRAGWEEAAAVHFSNFSMKPNGFLPRYKHIPRIRPLLD